MNKKIIPIILKDIDNLESEEVLCLQSNFVNQSFNQIYLWANKNKILPFVAKKMQFLNLDNELWAKEIDKWKTRNSRIKDIVYSICKDQRLLNANFAIYENFGSLLSSKKDISLFSSGDVDLYCSSNDDFSILKQILLEFGFQQCNRRNTGNLIDVFEYKDSSFSFFINVERKVVAKAYNYSENVIKKRMDFFVSQSDSFILSLEQYFYLNCLHISMGHYYCISPSYRLYFDLECFSIEKNNIKNVLQWAKEDGTLTRVLTTILLYQKLFNYKLLDKNLVCNKYVKMIEKKVLKENFLNENLSSFDKIFIDSYSDNFSIFKYALLRILRKNKRIDEHE